MVYTDHIPMEIEERRGEEVKKSFLEEAELDPKLERLISMERRE